MVATQFMHIYTSDASQTIDLLIQSLYSSKSANLHVSWGYIERTWHGTYEKEGDANLSRWWPYTHGR